MDRIDKPDIRNRIREQRKNMSPGDVRSLSSVIQERILSSAVFKQSRTVMAYMPIQNEVMTDLVISAAYAAGKIVCLPRVADAYRMDAVRVNDPKRKLVQSKFGIMEPDLSIPAFNPMNIDLVIVPGIAFDRAGHRIGFGKGYYDRFVQSLKAGCYKIAPAYAFQVLNKIPFEERDLSADIIFTEKEQIATANMYSVEFRNRERS